MKPTTALIAKTFLLFLLLVIAVRNNVFGIYDKMFDEQNAPKTEEPMLFDNLFDFDDEDEGNSGPRNHYRSYFFSWSLEDFLPRMKNYKAMEDDDIREY